LLLVLQFNLCNHWMKKASVRSSHLPRALKTTLEARKSPVQARSTASVEAILRATIQVLLRFGKERLTTTRVAARAGVSVGTLYQYFPNKSALLRAALQRHMNEVVQALETVCHEQAGASLETQVAAIVTGFLEAKMRNVKASLALYAVSSDIDGARIAREAGLRVNRSIVAVFATAKNQLTTDPELVASMLQAAMAGVSRRLLESSSPESDYEKLRNELAFLASAYVRACSKGCD
jgi:AcrR family transcriptional regulator